MIISQTNVHDLDWYSDDMEYLLGRIKFYTNELSNELDNINILKDQNKIDLIISAYTHLQHLMKVVKLYTK